MSQHEVRVLASDQMTQMANANREDNMIRLTKNMRNKIGVNIGDKVSIGKKNKEIKVLEVNRAYIHDTNLVKQYEDDIAFVSGRVNQFYNLFDSICWIKKYDLTPLITIGSDPEFILLENNVITPAYFIEEQVQKRELFSKYSKLGSDGTCAEIRPDPSNDACNVHTSIKTIINDYSKYDFLDKYKWQTGTLIDDGYRKFPLGGHIHLGLPKYILKRKEYNATNISQFYQKLFISLIKLLDYYIAFPLLAVELDKKNERRLTRWFNTSYGQAGEYRVQPHGLEWRTISGIWLSNPEYALAILNVCYELTTYLFQKLVPPDMKDINEIKVIENLNNIVDNNHLEKAITVINTGFTSTNKKACNERLKELSSICNNKYLYFLESLFTMTTTEIEHMTSKDLRDTWLS